MNKPEYRDLTIAGISESAVVSVAETRAFLLAEKPASLAEFCGYCAVVDLSAENEISTANVAAAVVNCLCDIGIAQAHLSSDSPKAQPQRWLIKSGNSAGNLPTNISAEIASWFRQNDAVLVGFDCSISESAHASFAGNGIMVLSNLKLEELQRNQRGMLVCGPLKVDGELAVPCRVIFML
jgi:kynurenine formamidase